MIPAPVFRASAGHAAVRSVSGQECFGSAAAVRQVECVQSVSGAVLSGAAGLLGLVALGAGLLERQGYEGQRGQERPRPISKPHATEQTRAGGNGISDSDDDSGKGEYGTKPMTPWDFRTSSPPG